MITFNFFVRPERDNSLVLRLTNHRKSVKIALGLQMTPAELADALSEYPEGKLTSEGQVVRWYRSRLREYKCELLQNGGADIEATEARAWVERELMGRQIKVTDPTVGEWERWFNRFANTHPEGSRTRKVYLHTLARMRDHDPDLGKRRLREITVEWLEGFDGFLAKTMGVNSRNHHMRNIRAVIKYAIRNDADIRNPFDRMQLRKEETAKRSLTVEQLRRLMAMEVDEYAQVYRDMFMLSFMLIGINPIDLYNLEGLTSDGRAEYRRAKTHKLYSIKVEPEAEAIIRKYAGTGRLLMLADRWKLHESFAKCCNKALHNLGARKPARGRKKKDSATFPNLTLYWARHTWATIAAELDIPDAVIAQALGHSGPNKVTEIYIRRNLRKVDEANRQVLDFVLYGKTAAEPSAGTKPTDVQSGPTIAETPKGEELSHQE